MARTSGLDDARFWDVVTEMGLDHTTKLIGDAYDRGVGSRFVPADDQGPQAVARRGEDRVADGTVNDLHLTVLAG